jgi:hypothetical protein
VFAFAAGNALGKDFFCSEATERYGREVNSRNNTQMSTGFYTNARISVRSIFFLSVFC